MLNIRRNIELYCHAERKIDFLLIEPFKRLGLAGGFNDIGERDSNIALAQLVEGVIQTAVNLLDQGL